jgi:hypothetical protein
MGASHHPLPAGRESAARPGYFRAGPVPGATASQHFSGRTHWQPETRIPGSESEAVRVTRTRGSRDRPRAPKMRPARMTSWPALPSDSEGWRIPTRAGSEGRCQGHDPSQTRTVARAGWPGPQPAGAFPWWLGTTRLLVRVTTTAVCVSRRGFGWPGRGFRRNLSRRGPSAII